MKTYSFIGSDKNAGKTTAFNYVYRQLLTNRQSKSICLSSIGINGEDTDSYEGTAKPHIELSADSFFITCSRHLEDHTGKYQTLLNLRPPFFGKDYIFGKALMAMNLVLEGPNNGNEVREAKQQIAPILGNDTTVLIDGSIDRQFLARPEISDGFYFSVLFSGRPRQLRRCRDFLTMISLPTCAKQIRRAIAESIGEKTKSLLMNHSGAVLYRGETFAAKDAELKAQCEAIYKKPGTLYLRGGLTSSMHDFLAPFTKLRIVLDNFTLFLSFSARQRKGVQFRPKITLYHRATIKTLFIRQQANFDRSLIPPGMVCKNIFRELHHEG